jgi:hypothetical protein
VVHFSTIKWVTFRLTFIGVDVAQAWDEFRERHPKIVLETRLAELRAKHGAKSQEWTTFLSEVRLRLLSLLLLNVRNVQK